MRIALDELVVAKLTLRGLSSAHVMFLELQSACLVCLRVRG